MNLDDAQTELAESYVGETGSEGSQALAIIDINRPPQVIESRQVQQVDPYFGAGSLDLTDKQRAILSRAFDPSQLEILPTGEVYAPQVEYRRRFNEAFGIGRWALRPLAEPKISGKTVVRWYALYIDGKFAAETFGESDFIDNNPRFTWGTALESAKSNALMRCGKDIGVNLECWDRTFTKAWQKKYARRDSDGKWQKTHNMDGGRDGNNASATHPEHIDPGQDEKGTATSSASSSLSESAARSSSSSNSRVITPTEFTGKGWKLKDNTPCTGVKDSAGDKWSLVGASVIDTVEQAIIQKKDVRVSYKRNGAYLNVHSAEIL